MNFTADRQACLDLVEGSPKAVAVKDRAAWLSLFARYNIVEDPVGSAPHLSGVFDPRTGKRGNGALGRFFDTFIAPNEIVFHVDRDIVCVNKVVRDLTIEIHMSPQVVAEVPMHLLYELTEEERSGLKIRRLAAHWEAWPMVKSLLAQGAKAMPVLLALGLRMIRNQGLSGVLGFTKGLFGIGERGKWVVREFETAYNSRNSARLMEVFHPDNRGIEFPSGGDVYNPVVFLDEQTDAKLSFSKLLAAGPSVTATVGVVKNDATYNGVAVFEFNMKTRQIEHLQFFWDQASD